MLILNDRTPAQGHDPEQIAEQLRQLGEMLHYKYILLDFQRPNAPDNAAVAKALVSGLPCPVGVSEPYTRELDCPVFLPPVPPHVPLSEYLSLWQGREVWLDAALGGEVITVTDKGSTFSPLPPPDTPENAQEDTALHCHYHAQVQDDRIAFTLWRTRADLAGLLREAESLGVTLAVGLWQELS